LSNEEKRRAYDQYGAQAFENGSSGYPGGGPGGMDADEFFRNMGGFGGFGGFNPFGDMFGEGFQGSMKQQGNDIEVSIYPLSIL
jgi:DnaJ-class molecular chaperone